MFEKKVFMFMKFKEKAEKQLKYSPLGMLVLSKSNGSTQFYQFIPGERKKYLSKNNKELIQELAQKQYNIELIKFLDEQIQAMMTFDESIKPEPVQIVFDKLPDAIKEYVTPCETTNEQFLQNWKSQSYIPSSFPFRNKYITRNGEQVRSKTEVLIADKLKELGVIYKYECPLNLKGQIVYPDFTIMNLNTRQEIYYEHFGMMDNLEYINSFVKKINLYRLNDIIDGIRLFYTLESDSFPLDIEKLYSYLEFIASFVKE